MNKVKKINNYIDSYYENVNETNAQQAIDDFKEDWKIIIDYVDDYEEGTNESKYAKALEILSVAYHDLANTTETDIKRLCKLIEEFDNNDSVKYKFRVKQVLFLNLGLSWHKLGYDNKAIEAFKKHIYYLITLSSRSYYTATAFAFRKCDKYLYQALNNEQLNLSSPTTFNDPFDCPIIELLNNEDEVSKLMLQAYQDCLRIACFTYNIKLPYYGKGEKKHKRDRKEYLNELMWAHYADSHKGICIKYQFCNSLTQLSGKNKSVVSYLKDVEYSDKAMAQYSSKNSITLKDAFFLKGKSWEYENELRLLYYNLDKQDDHIQIDIPNSVEAIYFGLKCSEEDKKTIKKIMQQKKYIQKDSNGNIKSENQINFYQMGIDDKHFGRIKATLLK